MNHCCTYFDSRYLAPGLALWRFLARHDPTAVLWMLALDGEMADALRQMQDVRLCVVPLADVRAAVREIRAGRAVWERDGVAFTKPEFNIPLVAALRQAAEEIGGWLAVIDFGGSLGSTWWQHRQALADLPAVHWRVVEQPQYVAAGREFADEHLSFYDSLAGALAAGEASVILLSSVLPYLESPLALLDEVTRREFRHVIVDRTPLVRVGRTRLVVQHTPADLGGGSYPCWLFDRAQLLAFLEKSHALVQEWPAIDEFSPEVTHRGFHFQRKKR